MRPLRIYLKNFMNHRLSEVDCTNFQSVLVVGKSHKNDRISNGVGKTTLFRAVEYALFNQSHATTLDKVVRDGKKKAIVELDFELGGSVYRIYRHRTSTGSADVRMYKKVDGLWESISERTPSATDAKIREMIKITHKAFTYSVLFRQADLTGITSVTDPKKRREILKEPLNLSTYTRLEDMASKKVRPIKKEIDRISGSIEVIGEPAEDIKKANEKLVETNEQIESQKKLIAEAELSVKTKRKTIDELKQSLSSEDIDIHKQVSDKENELKNLREDSERLDKRLKDLASSISIREEDDKLTEKRKIVTQAELNPLQNAGVKDIEEIEANYDKVCTDELRGSELIAAAKAQQKFIKKSLPEGDECGTCHQSITQDYRKKIEGEVETKLEAQQKHIQALEDAMGKCKRKKARLSVELNEERTKLTKITDLERTLESYGKEQKANRENLTRLYADQEEANKKFQKTEVSVAEVVKQLNVLKKAASKSNAPLLNNQIFAIKQEIVDLEKNISSFNGHISNLSGIRGGLEERITTRKADKVKLKELKDELIKNKRELKIRQMVVDAFSNRGIPSFIIQTVLDELQFEANTSLKELRPELDVQIDADLNFEYRRNGVVRDYAQLSHGQHVYIALAFKRGTARVIQKRLGIDIRMLEFDEVDAHLDEAGAEAFADAIRKWQQDFTIFVITHNKDLKDKFSHAILVEEGDDGAEARLVTTW